MDMESPNTNHKTVNNSRSRPRRDSLTELTCEEKRIHIAELCGWGKRIAIYREQPETRNWVNRIPDYLGDLNAMHEAERTEIRRGVDRSLRYIENLCRITAGNPNAHINGIFASADDRANAFLLTLGVNSE